ncbi:Nlrc3 protein, partial [Globisporangium splendens]
MASRVYEEGDGGSERPRTQHVVSTSEHVAETATWFDTIQNGRHQYSVTHPSESAITELALSETLRRHLRDDTLLKLVLRIFSSPLVMVSIQVLDLSHNDLDDSFWTPLPSNGSWMALTSINISNNRFAGKSIRSIAALLSRCPALRHLDVSLNPFSSDNAANQLNSSVESFQMILQSIETSHYSHLSIFDLSCLRLTDDAIAGFLETSIVKRITNLYLRSNELRDATALRISSMLPSMALQVLSLAGNCISDRGLGALSFAIDQTNSLQTLDLEENQISGKGIRTLYHVLDSLSASFPLRYLHLHRNCVPNEQELLARVRVKLQEKILSTHLVDTAQHASLSAPLSLSLTERKLHKVLLMDTNLTDYFVEVALGTIRNCERWSALQELDLSGNAIAESGAYEIGLYVSLHPALRVLNLSKNRIDDRGIVGLAEGLEPNATLQELNLQDNQTTDTGAKVLYLKALASNLQRRILLSAGNQLSSECKVMLAAISQAHDLRKRFDTEFAHVEKLDFAGKSLRQYGAAAIVEKLVESQVRACTSLDLSRNGLGDDGALEIARLLRDYPPLQRLDISFNGIGDAGAMAIADALAHHNSTLTSLSLHSSVEGSVMKPKLLEKGLTHLAQALATHASIAIVDFRDNITTPTLVPVYVHLLKRNPRILKFNGSSAAVPLPVRDLEKT